MKIYTFLQKGFLLFVLAFGVSASAYSQGSSAPVSESMTISRPLPDGTRMEGGKVWTVKSGKRTLLQNEIVLAGGTHVKPDGQVITKSGYTAQLSDGDYINTSGKLVPAESKTMSAQVEDDDDDDE